MQDEQNLLRRGIKGKFYSNPHTLEEFSTDGSIFTLTPKLVLEPHDVFDISKLIRNINDGQLPYSITMRGRGTDQGGGALSDSIICHTENNLNKIYWIKKNKAYCQAGVNYEVLQNQLKQKGYFLPPYPASIAYATIGGSVANNAAGEKTFKYGATNNYVEALDVILANGDLVTVKKIAKRKLKHFYSNSRFYDNIVKQVHELLLDNSQVIHENKIHTSKNTMGYNIWNTLQTSGDLDLTQLITGSQSTLALISGVVFRTVKMVKTPPIAILAQFSNLDKAYECIEEIALTEPTSMEMVDQNLLELLAKISPELLDGLIDKNHLPKFVLIVEYDQLLSHKILAKVLEAERYLDLSANQYLVSKEDYKTANIWRLRRSAAAAIWRIKSEIKALPIIEDGVVPRQKAPDFLKDLDLICKKHKVEYATWGHAGDANFHVQPFLNLGSLTDRKKIIPLVEDFHKLVAKYHGSICAEHNDGLIRGKYLEEFYPKKIIKILEDIKRIFDPDNIFNPHCKLGSRKLDLNKIMRREYSMRLDRHLDH